MYEIKKTIYSQICQKYYQNSDEQIGHLSLNVLKKIDVNFPLKKILSFSFGNDFFGNAHHSKYSCTDWLILLFDSNEIKSFCVNQMFINLSIKELDIPLPDKDKEYLLDFAMKNMKNTLANYFNHEIKNFGSYYNMNMINFN